MSMELNALPLFSFCFPSCHVKHKNLITVMAVLAVQFLPFLCNNVIAKKVCLHVVCLVCWGRFLFCPSHLYVCLSLTDFSLLFLSLCLSQILAKGVEHLVHYFRDTAWYSTACLFSKTSSQPLPFFSLSVCMVSYSYSARTAHLHHTGSYCFHKADFLQTSFCLSVFQSLLSRPLCLSFSHICLAKPYNYVKSV